MRGITLFLLMAVATSCNPGRRYELRGQVLAVDRGRQEVTVKHGDIRGFMPAMTMPFKVREVREFEARTPGELIEATLVVTGNDAYLERIRKTGDAPLTEAPPAPAIDLLDPGETVPDEPFVDQAGTPHRLSDWRGKAIAVTFIYTRCPLPDFCPLMDRHFASIQKDVKHDPALNGRVQLVSVSFDPDFDTPKVLSAHAARVGADPAMWSFVTGQRDDIDKFASRFGVSIMRDDKTAQDIVHNLRTAVIDPAGRLHRAHTGNEWKPSEILADLRSALAVR